MLPPLPLPHPSLPWQLPTNWLIQHDLSSRAGSLRECAHLLLPQQQHHQKEEEEEEEEQQQQQQQVKVEEFLFADLPSEHFLLSDFNSRHLRNSKDSALYSDHPAAEKKHHPFVADSHTRLPISDSSCAPLSSHQSSADPILNCHTGSSAASFLLKGNHLDSQNEGSITGLSSEGQLPTSVLERSSSLHLLTFGSKPKSVDNCAGSENYTLAMSSATSASGEASVSSGNKGDVSAELQQQRHPSNGHVATASNTEPPPTKKKRNLPGTPDPDAEVIALSPKTLMATNRFVCEICNKGFQRDQNLQLHRRGHNLPWKLRQRTTKEIRKRVYICPEPSCVHHDPSRALGDLTGIKKHFCRKHGEKKWKCDKCSKRYAVQSDWKAHSKICGTREYRCDCGTLFSRRDSFITHRAFCDALAEENARVSAHRQGGTQHPGGSESTLTAGPAGGLLPIMGESPSAHSPSFQFKGGPDDSLSSASRPGIPNNISSLEGGIASLASRWVPPTSAPPKLSLWLGSGPGGPGPPNSRQFMGGSQLDPSSSLTSPESGNPFLSQSGRGMHTGMGMMGSGEFDEINVPKGPGMMMPILPGSGGMFANFPGLQDCVSGEAGIMAFPGMPSFAGVVNSGSRLSFTSSSVAGLGSNSAAGSLSTLHSQRQHTATAQMSATALLQKAAQMGATVSGPSLFRGFGLGCGDSSSPFSGTPWQVSKQEFGRAASVLSSALPAYPFMRRQGDPSAGMQALGSSTASPTYGGQPSGTENLGIQDFMNTLSGGACLFNGAGNNLPSSFGPALGSSITNGMMPPSLSSFNTHTSEEKSRSHHHSVRPQGGESSSSSRGGAMQKGEGGDRPTLDFLGVGGPGAGAGVPGGMGRNLSQRDVCSSITSVAGMEVSSLMDNVQTVTPGDLSSGHSWESS